ncbi:MAG: type II secretion system protein GspG [Akkermansiaceae bacterium]
MKKSLNTATPRGFTLIEMLVTITIIVILAGLSLGGFNYVTSKQANSKAQIQISLLSNALEEYKLDNGSFPTSAGGTTILYTALYKEGVDNPDTNEIYLSELDPNNDRQGWMSSNSGTVTIIDPWGEEFIYRDGSNANARNPDFDLLSKGKDGIEGTADDITNFSN